MSRILKEAFIAVTICSAVLYGCGNNNVNSESTMHSKIPAETASAVFGNLTTYSELNATSSFQQKAEIKAPATGFIKEILISQGDIVSVNKILFRIKTREAMALAKESFDSLNFNGTVDVRSATKGIVASLEHSIGDYVSEGDGLCQLAIPESFIFILEVPFELSSVIRLNSKCNIVLPDSQEINGIIRSELPSMSENSQTVKYTIKVNLNRILPENLTVKVRVIKDNITDAVSLPKSAILTNETMHDFWVMKLINDSMAVKIPVKTGISSGNSVQIIEPVIRPSDQFLITGNYGVGDTAFIKIIKPAGNDQ
jgi:multidrug efflux pump subunit AcrA (membrane-fusion protein)